MNIERPLAFGILQSSYQALYTVESPYNNAEIGAIWLENVSALTATISIGVMKNGINTNLLTNLSLSSGYKLLIDNVVGLSRGDSIQGIANVNGAVNFSIFGKIL